MNRDFELRISNRESDDNPEIRSSKAASDSQFEVLNSKFAILYEGLSRQ